MTMTEYLKSQRTTSQEDVDAAAKEHSSDDYKPEERVSTNV